MAFLTPAMVMQFHSQKLKKIPGLYHPFFKDFQDHTSFPGPGKNRKKISGLSRTFQDPWEPWTCFIGHRSPMSHIIGAPSSHGFRH
jgi:hypothetical protein